MATAFKDAAGRDFWDRFDCDGQSFYALGDVADSSVLAPHLRRKGERSLVSLLVQAQLRGALRSLIPAFPRLSDVLSRLEPGLVAGLLLLSYEAESSTLTVAGAGHPPSCASASGRHRPSVSSGLTVGCRAACRVRLDVQAGAWGSTW